MSDADELVRLLRESNLATRNQLSKLLQDLSILRLEIIDGFSRVTAALHLAERVTALEKRVADLVEEPPGA